MCSSGCVPNEIIHVTSIPRHILKSQTLKHVRSCSGEDIFPRTARLARYYYKIALVRTHFSSCVAVSTRTCLTGALCVCLRWRPDRRTRGPNKQSTCASTTSREAQAVLFTPYRHPLETEASYGRRETHPAAGLPGRAGAVSRPGPCRQGARLGLAGRAAEIGAFMSGPTAPQHPRPLINIYNMRCIATSVR